MNTPTTISIDALDTVLQDGDAIINFTSEALAAPAAAVSLSQDGTAKLINGPAYPIAADTDAQAISALMTDGKRLVVVTDGSDKVAEFVARISAAQVPHLVCIPDEACAADAFMDEEDADAVAERLRQLGYI